MKGKNVDQLVYEQIIPTFKTGDPQNFSALLQRCIIPEVRHETHSFFGHLDTQEAKYPGLDYNNSTHRLRLCRWSWHKRLFAAFDDLRLTEFEISSLTKWEGTKWAKEKYEKEQGITIRDTAADGLPVWASYRDTYPSAIDDRIEWQSQTEVDETEEGLFLEEHEKLEDEELRSESELDFSLSQASTPINEEETLEAKLDDEDEVDEDGSSTANEESDEDVISSVGEELNQRLRASAARREAGETSVIMDPEYEQWLKNALEHGDLSLLTEHLTTRLAQGGLGQSGLLANSVLPAFLTSAQ